MTNRGRWAVLAIAATLSAGYAVGCGGSSNPDTNGAGAEAGAGGTGTDAAAGTGGTGGAGGSGLGGAAGVGGAAGTGGGNDGGTGGTAGSGGSGGATGGMGGADGGSGGDGGTAGGGGTAGDGGTGGTGGSSCGACDDGVSCTLDWCEGTTCKHAIGPNSGDTACPSGKMCDLQLGCVQGPICANTAQCVQQLGADPCKTNITCNTSVALCEYTWLDNDHDGHTPVVCGGGDCDDGDAAKAPGKAEVCDGRDNDCNGFVDDGATCGGLSECIAGSCQCPADNTCGTACVDKATSNEHCGTCNHPCQSGAVCESGQCVCGPDSAACPSGCVDLNTDPLNCGACGAICAQGFSCANKVCTCTGDICSNQCVDKQTDPNNCGACATKCGANQTCTAGACLCAGGSPPCNGVCVNTLTDPNNCGGCAIKCAAGMTCQAGACKCPSPLSQCGTACVNLTNDPANCQTCGHSCGAGGTCVNSACVTCPPGDLVLLLDSSGSMVTTLTGSQTRWQAIQAATKTFITQSTTISAGLQFFPLIDNGSYPCQTTADCTALGDPFATCDTTTHTCVTFLSGGTSCTVADYASPAVALGALSSATQRNNMNTAIDAQVADGSTPMTVALEGVLSYAKARAQATSHRVAVVMITDGVTNDCPSSGGTADVVAIAQQYAGGSPRTPTYVIGVGTSGQADWTPTDWNQIAAAGGTTSFFAANAQAQIESALAAIRNGYSTCP